MENTQLIIVLVAVVAAALGFAIKHFQVESAKRRLKLETDRIVLEAKEEAKTVLLNAKNEALETRQRSEADIDRKRKDLSREDDRLRQRRGELDQRTERLEERDRSLNKRQSELDRKGTELEDQRHEIVKRLESVSSMTKDEARKVLMDEVELESRADMARVIRQIENEAKEEGDKKARNIISLAIQRVASDHVAETTTSVVALPSDEMKGRIIGRNGRNIRSFEQAAGVDVVVDDTPEAVTISSFDPVRREVARRALAKLVVDGRIHPANIEKTLKKEQEEVEKAIVEAGEQAVFDSGVPNLNKEIVKMLGRLKFRTSYGQNQLSHSVETSGIASLLAAELGANVELARMGGLLHDLGKAMDHNTEGTHAAIGAEFARRYGVNAQVVNAIAAHHHEVEQETVEAVIVESADAISGARPGARRESLEQYIKRIKALEDIANSYKGVEQSYALQAGREVRIFVKPEAVDDLEAARMARNIAKQIEETMQYPGQIKVTVLRETRAVDFAK
ncbi:MAG: ribonuclease Y [Anaerolineales bacterium]